MILTSIKLGSICSVVKSKIAGEECDAENETVELPMP
jgi:hypothetical protein